MFDSNLMLLDDATITGTGAEITGAWVDMWALNADIGPQISEYEVAEPPGQGGAVRPLVWTLIVGSAGDSTDATVDVHLEFSDDGAAANGEEAAFEQFSYAVQASAVRRLTYQAKARYVRYAWSADTSDDTIGLVSLGPVDGGEYTDY